MTGFNYTIDGDKIPHGKMYNMDGDFVNDPDYNHPDSTASLKKLIERASATQVTIGEDKSLYVYAPMDTVMTQSARHRMHDRIVKAYKTVYPDIKIFVGFVPLEFQEIGDKAVFKGKLDGTII